MEPEKRWYIVIIAVGILTVMLSACLGAFAGGTVGYWAGRKAGSTAAEKHWLSLEEWKSAPVQPELLQPESPFMPGAQGALVTDVVEDSPADRAGIRSGDFIIAVGGVRVDADNTLSELIRKYEPGNRISIELWSRGRQRTVSVRLAEHPDDQRAAYLGVFFQMSSLTEPPSTD